MLGYSPGSSLTRLPRSHSVFECDCHELQVYSETALRMTDKGLAQMRDIIILVIGMHQVRLIP